MRPRSAGSRPEPCSMDPFRWSADPHSFPDNYEAIECRRPSRQVLCRIPRPYQRRASNDHPQTVSILTRSRSDGQPTPRCRRSFAGACESRLRNHACSINIALFPQKVLLQGIAPNCGYTSIVASRKEVASGLVCCPPTKEDLPRSREVDAVRNSGNRSSIPVVGRSTPARAAICE